MRKGDATDPKGLIAESFRIDGITYEECRSIFLDWALAVPVDADSHALIEELLARRTAEERLMHRVLTEGLKRRQSAKAPGGVERAAKLGSAPQDARICARPACRPHPKTKKAAPKAALIVLDNRQLSRSTRPVPVRAQVLSEQAWPCRHSTDRPDAEPSLRNGHRIRSRWSCG